MFPASTTAGKNIISVRMKTPLHRLHHSFLTIKTDFYKSVECPFMSQQGTSTETDSCHTPLRRTHGHKLRICFGPGGAPVTSQDTRTPRAS